MVCHKVDVESGIDRVHQIALRLSRVYKNDVDLGRLDIEIAIMLAVEARLDHCHLSIIGLPSIMKEAGETTGLEITLGVRAGLDPCPAATAEDQLSVADVEEMTQLAPRRLIMTKDKIMSQSGATWTNAIFISTRRT